MSVQGSYREHLARMNRTNPLLQAEFPNGNACRERAEGGYTMKCPRDSINHRCSTHNAGAAVRMPAIVQATLHPAALSAMVGVARSTIAHQHAGSRGGFKHIVNTFDAEGTAFFVVPGADVVRNTLGLRSCHVIQVVRMVLWRPQVRFASDQDDRNNGSADRPHLFYPL